MGKITKIKLTPDECEIIHNRSFFTIKKGLTNKMYIIFRSARDKIADEIKDNNIQFPPSADLVTGRITRGENYKGLPFIVLDFPRCIQDKDVFLYRTLFWWGNYFSFTLHLNGSFYQKHKRNIAENIEQVRGKDIFISAGKSQWEHQLETPFAEKLDLMNTKELQQKIEESSFFKFSGKIDLHKVEKVPVTAASYWKMFSGII